MDGPVAQVVGWGLSLGLLALLLYAVSRAVRRARARDRERAAEVERCFARVATARGLGVERPAPYVHPIVGAIPVMPIVAGEVDGFALRLEVVTDGARDGDQWTSVKLRRAAGEATWPTRLDPGTPAGEALDRLREVADEVVLLPDALLVRPEVKPETDPNGRTFRIETDPHRLDRLVALTLELARALQVPR